MEMAMWILFCLFASIGIVQCGLWVVEAVKKTESLNRGYHLIPLYNDPEIIEPQIRLGLARLNRTDCGSEALLFVDMGLGTECREICDRLTREVGGVYVCCQDSIAETIISLE